ncbi:MAG: DUF1513 domain-containing protein [Pseudomonadota bacterium]
MGRIALGLGVLACGQREVFAQPAEHAAYAAIETSSGTGTSRARFFSEAGGALGVTPLDFRAHGMACHDRHLVVFPRRPGTRFAVVDHRSLEILRVVEAPPERHFFGHGAFTRDGGHLLVTENNLDTLSGSIGVYETGSGFRRLGQIELPGPGPHEIVRDPTRDLFFVALGGLETHPAYGRTPLNLSGFRSQVLKLGFDRGSIDPLGFWPGTEGISLRHLDIDAHGALYVGGQLVDPRQGAGERVLWRVNAGHAEDLTAGALFGGYVSSVASHGPETLVTSKEAHRAAKLIDGEITEVYAIEGASAAALGPGLASISGFDALSLNHKDVPVSHGFEFDNHGLAII